MLPPSRGDVPELYKKALGLQQAGDAQAALALYRRIRLTVPDQPEVLFQMGRIETEAGRPDAAEPLLRKALAAKPKEAAIWQALHAALSGAARARLEREAARAKIPLGVPAEARPIFRLLEKGEVAEALKRAVALSRAAPAAAAPAHALGAAQAAAGNWNAARDALETAVARDPHNAEAHVLLGRALGRTERPLAALARFDAADTLGATTARDRAKVLGAICRLEEAEAVLAGAARKGAPAEIFQDLALARAALRDPSGAQAAFATGLKALTGPRAKSRAVDLRCALARSLSDAGEVRAALNLVQDGLVGAPDNAALLIQSAQLRQTLGDLPAAEADLRRAIEIAPRSGSAFRAFANGRKTPADDPMVDRLTDAMAQPDLPPRDRRLMSFAAAKFAADRGDAEAEIAHLDRANRLMAKAFPYQFDADLAAARQYISDWERIRDIALGGSQGPADPVIFVTGLPRSGTTLVESILDAHPMVAAGGEMPFRARAALPAMEALRDGTADAAAFAEAGRRYLTAARRATGAPEVIVDKAISTYARMGHAAASLPGARFVVLRRDPRDTGLSLWRNMFPEPTHRYAYDQIQMARYIRLHEALVTFWADRLPERVHVIDYEALTADPAMEIPKLVAFCGLPWDPACLSPETNRRSVATLSFAQVRQPIGRGSVAGWTRLEAGLQDLLGELDRFGPPDLEAPAS